MKTIVRHVVFAHKIADVLVTDDNLKAHRVGYHGAFGWTCVTCDSAKCPAIDHAKNTVINLEDQ